MASHLMDLKGLGKELWLGEDAQDCVNRLRDEWDCERPPPVTE
ncbi:MAG TPA: hypothetical protein VII06_37835 [Chloroflexota bacterium]|jgi:hypothetical protein